MEVFRIAQEQFADDLSGNGSRLFGGRWNSEGVFAVYVSSSRSLGLLETLAHTPAKMLNAKMYYLITIFLPDNIQEEEISYRRLPIGWDVPDSRAYTKRIGDKFLANNNSLMLAVPSVMMAEEVNYVLNPMHADMKRVKIANKRRIYFDQRVL